MVLQTFTMADTVAKYENSALNKTDVDIIATKIKLFEKKKIPYRIKVSEVHNFDKKLVKRAKKIITNNKYILFNSWYTKMRQSHNHWLNSHDMWNCLKNQPRSKPFVDMFDYAEKLGKADAKQQLLLLSSSQSNNEGSDDKGCAAHDIDIETIKENNIRRTKMYEQIFKDMTTTYRTNRAPVTSTIYDQKIKNPGGLEKLNPLIIEEGMHTFKLLLKQFETNGNAETKTAVERGGDNVFISDENNDDNANDYLMESIPATFATTKNRSNATAKKRKQSAPKKNTTVVPAKKRNFGSVSTTVSAAAAAASSTSGALEHSLDNSNDQRRSFVMINDDNMDDSQMSE